jgi:hypothetical protein
LAYKQRRLRVVRRPNGKYVVMLEPARKNKESARILTNEVDKEEAERRRANLSKEMGIY